MNSLFLELRFSKLSAILSIIFLFSVSSKAQNTIKGEVVNAEEEPLIGATILWKHDATVNAVADIDGKFSINRSKKSDTLVVSYVGFNTLNFIVNRQDSFLHLHLEVLANLQEVVVTGRLEDSYVSTLNVKNVESLTSCELRKAPCCNLSEAFETSGAVDISYSDAITGATEIQMLGLKGIYTQLQIENRPSLNGLATPFGMDFIPGTWLESIQISKGASTILNGYQSISGQINVELVKPRKDKQLYVNLFGNTLGRTEANIHLNKKINEKWSTGLLLHGSIFQNQIDHDNDGFINMPLKKQLNGLYRLFYNGDKWFFQLNAHALSDNRVGGQLIPKSAPAGNYWRTNITNNRTELYGKMAFLGFKETYRNLAFQYSLLNHEMFGNFGLQAYNGIQRSSYNNLIYSDIIGDTDHKIILGATYQYDNFQESLSDKKYDRIESVTGAYAEYNYGRTVLGKAYTDLGIVAGLRVDQNSLYGLLITPRLNLKYNFSENSIIRASAGRGYHSPNIIAENIGQFSSNRSLNILTPLKIEEAWNYGINFTQQFNLFGRSGNMNFDFYRTDFVNQMVVDLDKDYTKILVYNLEGKSFSNSFLWMSTYELFDRFTLKLAYKWNDVKTNYQGVVDRQPFVAKHRGLITVDYKSKSKNWIFNIATQIVGPQRIPVNHSLPSQYHEHSISESPTYALLQAQITRKFGNLEIYVGGENITNYLQHNPIVAADKPFSTYFNAAQVYAPTMGARGYFGLRYGIN